MKKKKNSYALLVGLQNGPATGIVDPQKVKNRIIYGPAILLPGVCPKELKTGTQIGIYVLMFSAALFTIAKRWMKPKYLLSSVWIRKMWYTHGTEHYSSLKRKEILIHATRWMNLEDAVLNEISSVQSLSFVQLFAIPWTVASLSITNSWGWLKLMSIESVMPSNPFILCCPLLLPSIFPTIRVFSNESGLRIRRPKYWSFTFSLSPSNEYSGLIPFRMNLLDLLAVQVTLKSLLQHHSSKASILWCSAFFIVQLLHPYTTTGKTMALTR